MMVDTQSISPALVASQSTAAASSGLSPIPVTIATVSQALGNLTHAIQVNATVSVAPDNNTLTLVTSLGNITVNLTQQIASADQQNLLQQLLSISLSQKPLTLSLQPGSPPTQGVLLLPTPSSLPLSSLTPNTMPSFIPNQSFPALTTGQALTAIVLPADLLTSPALPLTPPGSQALPTQYQALNVPNGALPTDQTLAPTAITPRTSLLAQTPIPLSTASPTLSLSSDSLIGTPTLPISEGEEPFIPPFSPSALSSPPTTPSPSLTSQTTAINAQAVPSATVSSTGISPSLTPQTIAMPQPSLSSIPVLSTTPSLSSTSPSSFAVDPTLTSLLQTGNEVTLQIISILPTTTSRIPISTPPLALNQVTATVVSTGTDGQLILKTPDAVLFVKTQVSAPMGTNVVFTVEATKPPPLMMLPQEPAAFQNLPQIMAAIAQMDPMIFQHMMAVHIPQPTEALPGALLLLFSAFKQGNLRDWLGGDATDSLLRGGQSNLVASLSRELGGAGQTVQDAIVGEWRAYPIPLFAQQQFQTLILYVHNDREARRDQTSDDPSKVGKVRFLIDMSLSKLGAMQIDGFVQPKKLDMVLRSETLLPDGLHNDLRTAYIKSLGAVGYTGTLHFQVGRHHWMSMRQTAPQAIMT